jgi:hypothetical protein
MTKTIVTALSLLIIFTACEKKSEANFEACIEAFLKANNMVRYTGQPLSCTLFASLYELDGQPYFAFGNHCADMIFQPVDCNGKPYTPTSDFNDRAISKGIVGFVDGCANIVVAEQTPFELCIGQKAEGKFVKPLSITLQDIPHDNRCPLKVKCITAGSVDAKFQLVSPDSTSIRTLSLGDFWGGKGDSIRFDGYIVKLKAVTPYPEIPQKINPLDYRAIFEVYKAR